MASQRIEVITGAASRRRYSEEEKLQLVEEAFGPDASVTEVARRAGVDPSLLYRWRRQMFGARPRLPAFTPVAVAADDATSPAASSPAMREPGVIEIDITGGGARVRVTGAPEPATIGAVLAALTRRPA
jgi:transposase